MKKAKRIIDLLESIDNYLSLLVEMERRKPVTSTTYFSKPDSTDDATFTWGHSNLPSTPSPIRRGC